MTVYNFYPESLKKEIVREIKSGLVSKSEVRRKYGIRGWACIYRWISKFDENIPYNRRLMDYSKSDKALLIKRIKELERQLEDEQIRSMGLSKMIDIAEKQLKISIRKKSITKQSKR